jgi:hypothetical protein
MALGTDMPDDYWRSVCKTEAPTGETLVVQQKMVMGVGSELRPSGEHRAVPVTELVEVPVQ